MRKTRSNIYTTERTHLYMMIIVCFLIFIKYIYKNNEYNRETCFLSLILKESSTGKIVGAASFSDRVPSHLIKNTTDTATTTIGEWLQSETALLGRIPEDFLYIHFLLVAEHVDQKEAQKKLTTAAFSYNHMWQAFLVTTPWSAMDEVESGALSSDFTILTQDEDVGVAVFECTRATYLSPVIVRRARVEDYDDLLPVLESSAKRYPQLSTIPADESDVQDFALARLINSSDPHRIVLVAERNNKIEGMIVLTDEVDVEKLSSIYELKDYKNLVEVKRVKSTPKSQHLERNEFSIDYLPEEEEEEDDQPIQLSGDALIEALARENFESPTEEDAPVLSGDALLESALKQAEEKEEVEEESSSNNNSKAKDDREGTTTTTTATESMSAENKEYDEDGHTSTASGRGQSSLELKSAFRGGKDSDGSVAPVALAPFEEFDSEIIPKAMTMPMVCVDDAFTDVADAFLTESFNSFPDKEYCTMTFPHSSAVPLMLSKFNSTVPKLPETATDMLYVTHRKTVMQTFEVRPAELSDMAKIEDMLNTLPRKLEAFQAFSSVLEDGGAVVALCHDEVVGVAAVEKNSMEKDDLLQVIMEQYKPEDVVDLRNTVESGVGILRLFTLSPLFSIKKRTFFTEILRVLNLSCIIDTVKRDAGSLNEAVMEMIQLPRKHLSVVKGGIDSLIFAFSRKIAYRSRSKVNSRIVVVGASETGLAAVEEMLVSTSYTFTSLTLVTNGCTPADNVMKSAMLAKLGLEIHLTIVDAELVGLDRDDHSIALSDGSILAYEVLLLTPELRDQTCTSLGISIASAKGSVMRYEDLVESFDTKRASSVETVIVFGSTIEAYRSIHFLQMRGLPSEKIVWLKSAYRDEIGDLIDASMHKAGLHHSLDQIRQCVPGVIKGLDVDDDDKLLVDYLPIAHGSAAFQESIETLLCDILVTCDTPNTDLNIFESLNDTGIVYDGRVVVNASFQTNDRDIYAAGDVAKFSRRCADGDVLLSHFNAEEIGCKLARSLMDRFTLENSVSFVDIVPEPSSFPQFCDPKTVASLVPGPAKFFIIGKPITFLAQTMTMTMATATASSDQQEIDTRSMFLPLTVSSQKGGSDATSTSNQIYETFNDGYTRLATDEDGRIISVVYCGDLDVDMRFMQTIIGLLPEHLNDFHTKLLPSTSSTSGETEVSSLPKFLNQNWAEALYHQDFNNFKQELYEAVRACLLDTSSSPDAVSLQDDDQIETAIAAAFDNNESKQYEVVKLVQESMMDFIRAYKDDLPGYHHVEIYN